MWANWRAMPFLLQLLTVYGLACSVIPMIALASLLPGRRFSARCPVDVENVSYGACWLSVEGGLMVVIGVALSISAILFLRRVPRARGIYVMAVSLGVVWEGIQEGTAHAVFDLIILALLGLYLYRRRTVKAFFARAD